MPSLVPEVLASPGAPLESRLRGQMESRFGHDFGKVRVHQDGRAAASAAAVQARAYTVGHQIVLGSAAAGMTGSDTMPLLDHELAHVVQQDRAAGTSHSVGVLQRAGLDEPIVQAPSASASSAPENQAAGLPEPDCNTRVADLFLLGAISCPQRSECCFAQIHDRKNRNLTGIFRADHQLEGRPDCEYGDQKHHDFWLANHWRIVEITTSALTVMNMCGREETLDVEGIGTVKESRLRLPFPLVRPLRRRCRRTLWTIPKACGASRTRSTTMINAMRFISFPMSQEKRPRCIVGTRRSRALSMNTIPPIPKHQVNSRNSRGGVEGVCRRRMARNQLWRHAEVGVVISDRGQVR